MSTRVVFHEERLEERRDLENLLFQPDVTVADQYLQTIRSRSELEAEKRLMLAVLEEAVASFQKNILAHTNKGRAAFQEAEDWILEDNEEWPFSFRVICETFGIDPEWLRKGLMEWKRRKLKERSRKYRDAA